PGLGLAIGVGVAGAVSWAKAGAANATAARVATAASNRRMTFSWAAGEGGRCGLYGRKYYFIFATYVKFLMFWMERNAGHLQRRLAGLRARPGRLPGRALARPGRRGDGCAHRLRQHFCAAGAVLRRPGAH